MKNFFFALCLSRQTFISGDLRRFQEMFEEMFSPGGDFPEASRKQSEVKKILSMELLG